MIENMIQQIQIYKRNAFNTSIFSIYSVVHQDAKNLWYVYRCE